ncbi:MAG: chromate resistance protein [Actinomycetota bacterium]|nr:chromate resistance protein [Actinomycetota bacterium]
MPLDATLQPYGEWVLLSYRLPRTPSTPRIALWRRLRRLGAQQIGDGLVALPADARTREQLEWLADEVLDAGGSAGIWLARPASIAQERAMATAMANARAAEYDAISVEALRSATEAAPERSKTLARLRRTWREVTRRDYFPPPERHTARAALNRLASTTGIGTPDSGKNRPQRTGASR